MRYLFVIIIPFACIIISCDGRNRKYKSSAEVLQESQLLDSYSEQIKYIPEQYAEVEIDTVLNNGFRVKIKTYTNMESSVLLQNTKDSITYNEHYRNLESSLRVWNDDKLILSKVVNKEFVRENKLVTTDQILKSVWLDEFSSNLVDKIILNLSFCQPPNKACLVYKLIIDSNGSYKIENLSKVNI